MEQELDGAERFWRSVPVVLVILGSLFGFGLFVVAGFMPPPSPTAPAHAIAEIYQQHTLRIRIGVTIAFFAFAVWGLLVAMITGTMLKMENRGTRPVLAYTQLVSGAAGWLIVLFPLIIWLTAAFRPERDPQITQALNDLGWIMLVMSVPPFLTQMIAIAVAIFLDRSEEPLMPRWVGYLNLWITLLFFFDMLVPSFKTGISAWNGMLSFYIALVAFGVWIFVMAYWSVKIALDGLSADREVLSCST